MATELEQTLLAALIQAQLYLDSYDVSKPSRIQAETRAAVAEAIGSCTYEQRLAAETHTAIERAKALRLQEAY